MGRSLLHLIDLIKSLNDLQVKFISLNDSIDTSTATGRLIFNIFDGLAEFEREIIKERTFAGLAAAQLRGGVGGPRKGLTPETQLKAGYAHQLYAEANLTIAQILERTRIKTARTLYNYIRINLTHMSDTGTFVKKSKRKKVLLKNQENYENLFVLFIRLLQFKSRQLVLWIIIFISFIYRYAQHYRQQTEQTTLLCRLLNFATRFLTMLILININFLYMCCYLYVFKNTIYSINIIFC